MTEVTIRDVQIDECEIGHPSTERARAASEVGAAIAHQLNGPLTALRLYAGDLHRNSDRFSAGIGEGPSLKKVAENVLRETENICALMQRIGDAFVTPLQNETAIAHGRDVINWWSRTAAGANDGDHTADGTPATAASANSSYALLTPREREVLLLISQGLSNKRGAIRMQIGPRTFESHRARVMRKFNARNAADLVRMALQTQEPAGNGQPMPDVQA